MADRTLTITAAAAEHQGSLADTIPGSVAAGTVAIVMANGMTNRDVKRALKQAMDLARRDPTRVNGA